VKKATRVYMILGAAMAALVLSTSVYASTINLGPANQGAYYGEPVPGEITFTGNGAGGFSSVAWDGWIGTASGPNLESGYYSVQGGGFVAGPPVLDVPGGLEAWSLTDLGGNTLDYASTLGGLPAPNYLLADLVFTTLSGGPQFYSIQGTLAAVSGSLAPGSGALSVIIDLDLGKVDLSDLKKGKTATAVISDGELTITRVPEPCAASLSGVGLLATLLAFVGLKKRIAA